MPLIFNLFEINFMRIPISWNNNIDKPKWRYLENNNHNKLVY